MSLYSECYFWCTGGGQPPSVKGETDKDLIDALVGGSYLPCNLVQKLPDVMILTSTIIFRSI